ncbi:hypothetical protein [Limnobacter sp.]|uniref:hypothetical protein n=1 Tax=Limnobacter sp. TaxID=2003368 RepID=UPI003516035D
MDQGEKQIDVSRDQNRYITNRSGPFYITGSEIEVEIPFSGEAEAFKIQPNPYTLSPPRASVRGNPLTFAILGSNLEAAQVGGEIHPNLLDFLLQTIRANLIDGPTLTSIYISSLKDQHNFPSRHMQGLGKAVDISRINGMRMSTHYPNDPAVKLISDAIQLAFESWGGRRENFGPLFKRKHGKPHPVAGHTDHIHLSVD